MTSPKEFSQRMNNDISRMNAQFARIYTMIKEKRLTKNSAYYAEAIIRLDFTLREGVGLAEIGLIDRLAKVFAESKSLLDVIALHSISSGKRIYYDLAKRRYDKAVERAEQILTDSLGGNVSAA